MNPQQHSEGKQQAWGFALLAAGTILVSAFLLFQVQPVISKMILPWFGGSSAVWSTCMLFFQMVLLAGYGYAHWLTRSFVPRTQIVIHVALLLLALITLPISPTDSLRPIDGNNPSLRILSVLTLSVGLPYFLLSSTGPLVQAWFARVYPGLSPYRLYALSNVGSLAALLSYPFLFEPRFTLAEQDRGWSIGFGLFALLNATLTYLLWRTTASTDPLPTPTKPSPVAAATKSEALDQIPSEETPTTIEQKLLWVLLPALASVALLAVTNHLSQDMAAVPFLWVMPLSLYLISFILTFDSDRWYQRWLFCPLLMLSVLWLCVVEGAAGLDTKLKDMNFGDKPVSSTIERAMNGAIAQAVAVVPSLQKFKLKCNMAEIDYDPFFQAAFYLPFLFLGCMVCHGELARLKPVRSNLTGYYLMISAGGALGGMFVALACPRLFSWYVELPLVMAGIFLVAAVALALMIFTQLAQNRWVRFAVCAVALAAVGMLSGDMAARNVESAELRGGLALFMAFVGAALAYGIVATSKRELQVFCASIAGLLMLSALFGTVLGGVFKTTDPTVVAAERSFYGALQVKQDSATNPTGVWLTHGRIQHGYQHLEEGLRDQPTTYYARGSGIGIAIRRHPSVGNLKVGVIGLGAGTIAAYGEEAREIRFYEIDELVHRFSDKYFTFRKDSAAKTEVVLGDARLQMEREEPQGYDVIAVDAFSGDAIPVHLLTRECLAVYLKHLQPDGILAVHISNRYLNLAPIVRALAARAEMQVVNIHYLEQQLDGVQDTSSQWMLVSKNEAFFADEEVIDAMEGPSEKDDWKIEWTDQYSNLWDILQ